MPDYRLYLFDSHDHIVSVLEQLCAGDMAALDKARLLTDGCDVEIWAGARNVGRVRKGDAPLDAGDPGSL
jgi:hypothetical protein